MGGGSARSRGEAARRRNEMAFSLACTVFAGALLGVHHAVDADLRLYAESMVLLGGGEGQTHGGPDVF